ncbi:hypothetical protein TrVE_jg2676 [Triparma verrucosa]|uniref:Short-chain dehydrogenase n=1 Tax=Triparma verrucosa TaxID=1606542 RepID=A0A9W7B890_9STRA|nr:hypothetical protein TrVE_jg2676 [Triparma verrucosa]
MIPSLSAPAHAISAIGKNFIVTGGSQGLGYAIAEQLAGSGADNIAILARTKSTGEAAAEKLSSLNPNTKAHFYATDLSDPASIKASCASTISDLSKISGLVNAAATTERGNLETTTSDDFDWQMICNARGPFLMSQAISNHMKSEKIRGSIVNITSVASKGGAPFIMAYSMSKAALECMTRNNAAELAPHGIRVNGVAMGWCYTENEDKLQTLQSDSDWIKKADCSQPIGRILRPEDVASTVNFLLSDASNMMTGNIVDLHPEMAHGMLSLDAVDTVER